MTREECEARALADFAAVKGKLIRVRNFTGFSIIDEDQHDFVVDPPILVRVTGPEQPEDGILHWVDSWVDPYWGIEVVEDHGQVPAGSVYGAWMFGHSYQEGTGRTQRAIFLVEGQ